MAFKQVPAPSGISIHIPYTLSRFIENASGASASLNYARNTGRVAHFVVGDSNAHKDECGIVGGLIHTLAGRGMLFGTGLQGAMHRRSGTSRGNGMFWPYYGDSVAATGFYRNTFMFSGAVWTEATKTLSGTFTNYAGKAGDRLTVTAGANASADDYIVVSGNSVSIVLSTSIGASATTGIGGYLSPASGTTSFSTMAQAYHDAWNVPIDWEPMGACMLYHPSGSDWLSANWTVQHVYLGAMNPSGGITHSLGHLGFASGASAAQITIRQYQGPSYTDLPSNINSAVVDSTGTAGSLLWSRVSAAVADRVTTQATGGREYIVCGSDLVAPTTGAYCYLFSHSCVTNMATGCSVQGFLCKGGQSAHRIATTLMFCSDGTVDNFLRGLVDQCSASAGGNGTRRAHCWICTGFNDHASTATSVGPNPSASSRGPGYVDNIAAIRTRFKARWDALYGAGASDTELHFTIVPSHPVSDAPTAAANPPVSDLAVRQAITGEYVQYAGEFARQHADVSCVDLFSMLSPAPFTNLYGKYLTITNTGAPTTDDIMHLNPAGYNYVFGRVIDEMLRY